MSFFYGGRGLGRAPQDWQEAFVQQHGERISVVTSGGVSETIPPPRSVPPWAGRHFWAAVLVYEAPDPWDPEYELSAENMLSIAVGCAHCLVGWEPAEWARQPCPGPPAGQVSGG